MNSCVIVILISERKIDFKRKILFKKTIKGHYEIVKGSIQPEVVITVNLYAPKAGVPGYLK